IRRAAETAKILLQNGLIVICSFITPTEKIRQQARQIIGDDYLEVYIKCSFKTCAERDVKGLYQKALRGEIKNFTGLDAPFEEPQQPWLELDTENDSLENCTQKLLEKLLPLIKI
ncbi:MAG: adenylyl-sulfate kinase, partial [Hymenobacteraceae bacterium]|nr:adenylyl-sulfate kinase [Hymenobacteraceae bacterium]